MVERSSDRAIGVRRLGFGVSGPHGTALVAPKATEHMIRHAFELGVRLFDTGPSYGNGEAERRLGEAMRGLPRFDCIISTKVGVTSAGATRRIRDFSPDAVRRSIDASLRRLQMHRLDWLFLHGPAPSEITDGLMKVIEDEQFAGRVGMLGVAGRGPEIDIALATGKFSVFMAPVHAGLADYNIDRLHQLKAKGAELVGIECLAPALARFPAPTSSGAAFRLAKAMIGRAGPGSARTMAPADALGWALSNGGAHRVLTSTTSLDHLRQNAAAVESAPDAA
ncbi:MAG: aldo/keto reductase [Alphaproteobacteria bacterium]|nr:aldo/keto reductase [Alphaproteobacteria bacterium]